MDSLSNLPDLVAEFVVAYYSAFVHDFRSVIKFYDPEKAQVYRQSLTNGTSVNVNEAKTSLVPNLKGHEKLIVLSYSFNPLLLSEENNKYFNVVVIGKIVKNENESSQFSQFFTLEIVNSERIAIISDSLTIIPQNNTSNNIEEASGANCSTNISPSEILFEIDRRPPYLRQNQKHQQQQQLHQQQQQTQPNENEVQKEENNNNNQPSKPTNNSNKSKKGKGSNGSSRFVYTPGSSD